MNAPRTRRPRRLDWRRLFRAWIVQHAQAMVLSVGQMFRNPVGSLLTIAVIGVSLALPTGFYLVLQNAQAVASGWGGNARIALYLKLDTPADRARDLAQQLRTRPGIESVQYISREESLAEYKKMSGFSEVLDALEDNPLPAVILVQPRLESLSGVQGDRLIAGLRALKEVDVAQFDRQWVQRLLAITEILKRGAVILAVLLALAVLLIIGNTIRLAIFNRRAEIEINLLFGATHAFIQRPFLYSGLVHGIGGGLVAWLLVNGGIWLLSGPAGHLAELYLSSYRLTGLSVEQAGALLGLGGFLGLAGSWLAVQRHLREIGRL